MFESMPQDWPLGHPSLASFAITFVLLHSSAANCLIILTETVLPINEVGERLKGHNFIRGRRVAQLIVQKITSDRRLRKREREKERYGDRERERER